MEKKVLDATCGSRMIWFNKNNPVAIYVDKRELHDEATWKSSSGLGTRRVDIKPDILADFTALPFEDNSFYLVVFDPPHLTKLGESAWLKKKYGKLDGNWKQVIHDGFWECMRVLRPNGTLIFKWCEYEIPTREVLQAIACDPLFGNRSGKQGKTHWMTFMKEADETAGGTI